MRPDTAQRPSQEPHARPLVRRTGYEVLLCPRRATEEQRDRAAAEVAKLLLKGIRERLEV